MSTSIRGSWKSNVGLAALLAACQSPENGEMAGDAEEAAIGNQQMAVTSTDPVPLETAGRVTPFSRSRKHPHHPENLRAAARAGVGALALVSTPLDTLAQYAAKCEDATGIKIPSFTCENGAEVQQATGQVHLTDNVIGTGASGSRTVDTNQTIQRVTALGADIWGTSDQFVFSRITSLPPQSQAGNPEVALSGNGSIEVLVKSLTNTHEYAKAGVMFRSSTATNSANVALFVTPSRGVIFQRRLTNNGQTVSTELSGRTAPTWLRITRSGSNFSAFTSYDRVTWTQVGPTVSATAIPTAPMVGLAVTSHNTSTSTVAVFDKFAWAPANLQYCDRPNVLNGVCDPGSRFQVIAQTGDATAVANCRKEGYGPGRWGDVAVIQYNKVTGGICFYQALPYDRDLNPIGDGQGLNATNTPAPAVASSGTNFRWYTTTETADVGCPRCHDNGGFIRSPYLTQTGLLPNEAEGYHNYNPLNHVGADFTQERSWAISTANWHDGDANTTNDPDDDNGTPCNGCHQLAVNNNSFGEGTAANFAPIATAPDFTSWPGQTRKHAHSVESPSWMRPGQILFHEPTSNTAFKYSDCAVLQWYEGLSIKPKYFTNLTSVPGCSFTPLANRWWDTTFNHLNIGVTNGTGTQSGTTFTLTNRGTDIYGTSDQFQFALMSADQDGMLQVKVNSLTNTHAFAKAGLMFRNGIGTTAEHAMVHITPTSGAQFQYRPTAGANVVASTPLTPRTAPVWLRLYKSGSVVSGWVSNDNVTYNQVAPAFTMPVTSLIHGGMAVTSHNVNQTATGVFDRFSWIPAQHNLMDANIGVLNGTQTLSGANRVITVAGSDIYGTSDQFFFSFKQITSGSATIIARVNSIGNTHAFAKAGLMIRSSIEPGARHAMVQITPTSGAQFQYRSSDNTNVVSTTPLASWRAPSWLRLRRTSTTTFTGSVSPDGETWTDVGTINIAGFPTTSLIGLAVTSHNAGAATTATFSNVYVP